MKKIEFVAVIVSGIIVSLALETFRKKREAKDNAATEESMHKLDNFVNDAMNK